MRRTEGLDPRIERDRLTTGEKRKVTHLRRDLVQWFTKNGRDFSWRNAGASQYEQIVVEVLLQRTTASAVAKFFPAFVNKYPGWHELAAAKVTDLEEFLRPLGLWQRRAKSLMALAHYAANTDGEFPPEPSEHATIPAVGQYVSNAIMLFQHGKPAPLIDVNMARVLERFIRPRRLADLRHDPWLQSAAWWYARGKDPKRANWAMLDFAAAVCKSRRPLCQACPVNSRCAFAKRRPHDSGSGVTAPVIGK